LSGRGLCDGPIPRPEDSYRLWCVSECDQVKINNLDTCCEQVGRRGKDCETKRIQICNFFFLNTKELKHPDASNHQHSIKYSIYFSRLLIFEKSVSETRDILFDRRKLRENSYQL
jgi:hypothetical protein